MAAMNGRKASQGGVELGDEALAAAVLGRLGAAVRDAYRVADRIDAMLNAGGLDRFVDWSRSSLDRRDTEQELAAAATVVRYAIGNASGFLLRYADPVYEERSEIEPESAPEVIAAMRAAGEELLRVVDDYNALGWVQWGDAETHRDVRRWLLTAGVVLFDAAGRTDV